MISFAEFAALSYVAVGGMLVGEVNGSKNLRRIFKPIASLCFLMAALTSEPFSSYFGTLVFAALVFSAIGDVFLLSFDNRMFLYGLISFLLAHVCYIASFLLAIRWDIPPRMSSFLMIFWVPVVSFVVLWKYIRKAEMRGPVLAYCLILSLMVGFSSFIGNGVGPEFRLYLHIAPVLFCFSDVAVAWNRFVAESYVTRLWGLPLYYTAQLMFAASCGA